MNTSTLRAQVYSRLAITPEMVAAVPRITPQLQMIERTMKGAGQIDAGKKGIRCLPYGPGSDIFTSWSFYIELLEDPDAVAVMRIYRSLSISERRALSLEAFCVAANVPSLKVLRLIRDSCIAMSREAASIVASLNHPRVVEKTVEVALTSEGIADRNTLHKATGFLPTPKSAQTIVSVNTSATAQAATAPQIASAPSTDQVVRRLADLLHAAIAPAVPLALAPAPAVDSLPARMPYQEAMTISASGDDDSLDDESGGDA